MLSLVVALVVLAPEIPPECQAPPAREVSGLTTFAQSSGSLSVGLDSVATWCFDSGGTWTAGQTAPKGKTVQPNAEPTGDCRKAVISCEAARASISGEQRQLLVDVLADLERPFLGVKYKPKRSGLAERPPEVAECSARDRSTLFAHAQARMDLARLASQAQSEYANYRTWLFSEGLKCAQAMARGEKDFLQKRVAIDAPTQGGGTQQVPGTNVVGAGGTSAGGSNVGGANAGGANAGGATAGVANAGGAKAGGTSAGGSVAGGTNVAGTAGGSNAAGANAGGTNAGGANAGGANAGGTNVAGTAGGTNAGVATGGGSQPGGSNAGSANAGGASAGANAGGTNAGGTNAGGLNAGNTNPANKLSGATTGIGLGGPTAEREKALNSSMLEKWRYFLAEQAKIEIDADWVLGFLASRELRDCRCVRMVPGEVVRRLENKDRVAQLEADDEKNTRCELCLLDVFPRWKLRVQKQCALAPELSDFELGVLQRSDDGNGLPPRCIEAARQKQAGKTPAIITNTQPNPKAGGAYIITRAPEPQPVAPEALKPDTYAPMPAREEGRVYVRVFTSASCTAELLPGPVLARTGDLMPVPPAAKEITVQGPCGGFAEVYFGKEEKPRVAESFARNQPLRLQFRQ